jgi:deoxyguanosine kinase|tara:strand:- start:1118 stop:1786 length:669 start_codon:yes stop_codon:yes gene_type:complete
MLIVSVEGNIGSGKSTLISQLKNEITSIGDTPIVYIDEPVRVWNTIMDKEGNNIIKCYYKDQKKYAFQFQMMAYITRITQLRKAVELYDGKCIIITERSIETDRQVFAKMLYENKTLDNISYTIYLKWFDELSRNLTVDNLIYLKTTPSTSFDRVIKRNRPGETISLDYLEDCHEHHERWLQITDGVLYLDGDIDNSVSESFERKVSSIRIALESWYKYKST